MSKNNLQEIFDTAVGGILKQGSLSRDQVGKTCLYRDSDGNKCVAGQLLPDEHYYESMEGIEVNAVGFFLDTYNPEELSMLRDLQESHDIAALGGEDPDSTKALFSFLTLVKRVAGDWKLEWSFGKQLSNLSQEKKRLNNA